MSEGDIVGKNKYHTTWHNNNINTAKSNKAKTFNNKKNNLTVFKPVKESTIIKLDYKKK